jgi:hypothetical protein
MRVLIVMREEFLADLDSYKHLLPDGLANRMRLGRLNREAAADALRWPLDKIGVTIEQQAMDALLDTLTCEQVRSSAGDLVVVSSDDAEPVHLQIVARQLWESLPSDVRSVTLHDVKGLESKDPLGAFYESCVDEAANRTGVRRSEILRWCADALITPAGTRAIVYRGMEQSNGMTNRVVDLLQEEHLIRAELRAGAQWIELAHDQFVRPVLALKARWDAEMAAPLQTAKTLERRGAEWADSSRWSAKGLGPGAVEDAEQWLRDFGAEIGVSQRVRDFIAWSRKRNEETQRQTRRLHFERALLIAGLIAAVTVAWWAWVQNREKSEALDRAHASERALVVALAGKHEAERARDVAENAQRTAQRNAKGAREQAREKP